MKILYSLKYALMFFCMAVSRHGLGQPSIGARGFWTVIANVSRGIDTNLSYLFVVCTVLICNSPRLVWRLCLDLQHVVVSVLWLGFLCSLFAANLCNITYHLSHSNRRNLQDARLRDRYTVVAYYVVLILLQHKNKLYIKYITRS
jgi:hypothetical protein